MRVEAEWCTGRATFMVPAIDHGLGREPSVDWPTAIMDWVEKGTAPSQLTYTFTPARR